MENTEKVVYLDNAATTACAPEALAVMVEALNGACGNPSSHYSVGYEAKEFVDKGRAQVAKAINASTSEIFFTGCGSEADNWAVKGTAFTKARQNKKHLITSAFEHHAIMHSMAALERLGFEVTYIKPTTEGYIRPEDVEAAIRPDTALISIMMANNEIGTIQPIKEIAEIAHKHGVWMHTDAVQAVGAIPVDVKELGVDMLSMSAHKFNGPKGMGALYCRKGIWPQNLIDGGSQEARHRAGTENVAGIAGMGKALEMATEHLEERMAHEKELRDYVIDRILKNIPEARLNGGLEHRLPGNVNISFPGMEGETTLLDLDMHGICASTGSACNSDSLDPSHVLLSIGVPEEIGHGSMRFTFGPQNTMEEAKYLRCAGGSHSPPSCYELYVAAGPEHGPSLQPEGRKLKWQVCIAQRSWSILHIRTTWVRSPTQTAWVKSATPSAATSCGCTSRSRTTSSLTSSSSPSAAALLSQPAAWPPTSSRARPLTRL